MYAQGKILVSTGKTVVERSKLAGCRFQQLAGAGETQFGVKFCPVRGFG